jgi:hypothetical protein
MSTRTRFLLGSISLLLIAAFLNVGRDLILTAQDGQLPTAIGESNLTAMDSDHFALYWNVAASGGGTISSTNFRLSSTVGQPVIGNFDSAHFELRAGFWQELIRRIFLPIVTKN